MGRQSRPLGERFWEKVEKGSPDECWEWVGAKLLKGYGRIWHNSTTALAHRVAWELTFGLIPEGVGYHGTCVLHHCDNPSCVNPCHLFLGTQADNVADRDVKGRVWRPLGELSGNAKLTWEQVRKIRKRYAHGGISQRGLAGEFGIGQSQVNNIVNGKRWGQSAE